MAKKTVLISDLSGQDIADGDEVEVRVLEYPSVNQAVRLDAATNEVADLRRLAKQVAVLELVGPDGRTERIIIEADDLAGAVQGDIDEVLAHAELVHVAPRQPQTEAPRRGRRPRGEGAPASTTDKVDYTSPEHAGTLHRGRITEVEAEWVRNNLDAANENRRRAGQPEIDVNDEKEVKRYGLMAGQVTTPPSSSQASSSPTFRAAADE